MISEKTFHIQFLQQMMKPKKEKIEPSNPLLKMIKIPLTLNERKLLKSSL